MPDGGEDAAIPAMPPARWQDRSGTGDPPVAPDLAAYQSMQMRWLNLVNKGVLETFSLSLARCL